VISGGRVCAVYAMRINKAISFLIGEGGIFILTKAVEWMWIDADLQLFGLNLLIIVTAETVSSLLGLVY